MNRKKEKKNNYHITLTYVTNLVLGFKDLNIGYIIYIIKILFFYRKCLREKNIYDMI